MALRLFNTITRTKEDFIPISEEYVGMYCCGPTVYNYAHIGNLRTYIFEDILRRVLEYNEFKVKHVMNITDVGHLTSDADEGEDKMEAGAIREGKTVYEIAEFYTEAFFEDLSRLNIMSPTIICKATEHIEQMIKLVQKLEEKDMTYVSNGNVYYDISKFKYYKDLGHLNLDEMRETERAINEGKRNPQDFVLWFTQSKFENHAMQWDSPWGKGYPGWHIECSAMSCEYLGEQFDIHCGGVDHIQVHHTNEIAQSEGAFEKHPWVKYWVHGEFLVLDKGKMSKSDGSFITLNTLIEKGYDPLVYRFFCFGTHYRQKLNFSFSSLDNAKISFNNIINKIRLLKENLPAEHENSKLKEGNFEKSDEILIFEKRFLESINDDLNMPQVIALVHEVLKSNLDSGEKLVLLYEFDKVLGFGFSEIESKVVEVNEGDELNNLLIEREKARKNKDWETADRIRSELLEKGFIIKDTPEGPILEKN